MHNNKKPGTKAGQKNVVRHCINYLTWFTSGAHTLPQVLNTPLLAVAPPVSPWGFFTSIGFQWPGSAQLCNSLRVKSASRLRAVLKYLAAPQQGVISTILLGANHG